MFEVSGQIQRISVFTDDRLNLLIVGKLSAVNICEFLFAAH
jgi:hypothetical protein